MIAIWLVAFLATQAVPSFQSRTGVVTGRILSKDGRPADHTRVRAVAVGGPDSTLSVLAAITETDSDGRYRLENIMPGSYHIAAGNLDLPTFFPGTAAPDKATAVTIAAGATQANMDFSLAISDGGRVSGRLEAPVIGATGPIRVRMTASVLDPRAGGPSITTIQGIFVATVSNLPVLETVVRGDGAFELSKAPFGKYILTTVPDVGLLPVEVVTDGDQSGVELKARSATQTAASSPSGITVSGRVNRIPEDRTIALSASENGPTMLSRIQDDGTFTFPNLPNLRFTVRTGPRLVASSTAIVATTPPVSGLEVHIPTETLVSGHIETMDGRRLQTVWPNATLQARHLGYNLPGVPIGANDTFALWLPEGASDLSLRNVPAGFIVVSISHDSRDLIRDPIFPEANRSAEIVIRVKETPEATMRGVSGTLKDLPLGAVGEGARIILNGFGPEHRRIETRINADGTFRFEGVPPDLYTTRLEGIRFEAVTPRIEVTDQNVAGIEISGRFFAEVKGRVTVVDSQGQPLTDFPLPYVYPETRGINGVLLPGPVVGRAGTFAIQVPAGEFEIFFSSLAGGYTLKSVTPARLRIEGTPPPEIHAVIERK